MMRAASSPASAMGYRCGRAPGVAIDEIEVDVLCERRRGQLGIADVPSAGSDRRRRRIASRAPSGCAPRRRDRDR
jgi:hypothetical protein